MWSGNRNDDDDDDDDKLVTKEEEHCRYRCSIKEHIWSVVSSHLVE